MSQPQPHPHREWNTSHHAHRNEQSNSYGHYRAGGGHRHDLRRVAAAQIMGLWNAVALVIRPLLTWITEMLDAVLLLVEYIWEMVEDIQAVASVRVFVTGYWEVTEPRKSCLGPIRNSYPNIIPGDQLYARMKEVEVIAFILALSRGRQCSPRRRAYINKQLDIFALALPVVLLVGSFSFKISYDPFGACCRNGRRRL